MQRTVLGIAILVMSVLSGTAWAQGSVERDPFHPPERTTTAPAVQQGDADYGRDPFSRPFSGPTTVQPRVPASGSGGLTGIIYGKNVRLAIINGEVVREGSVIGDRRLVDIKRKSVVMMNALGRQEELFLEDFSLGR